MIGRNLYGKGIEQMYRIEEREGERGVLKPSIVWNCQKRSIARATVPIWGGHWLSFEVLYV